MVSDTFHDGTVLNYEDYWSRNWIGRFDDQGNVKWVKAISGNNNLPHSLAVDKNGHIYLAGVNHTSGSQFGFRIGAKRGFVIELDGNGGYVAIDSFDVRNTTTNINAIAVDNELNKYIVGYANNGLIYNGASIRRKGRVDGFLLKVGADHQLKWSQVIGITGASGNAGAQSSVTDIEIDSKGDIIITGNCGGGYVEFGTAKSGLTSARDYFIAKFSGDGDNIWLHHGTSTNSVVMDDRANAIELDDQDNIYCTGVYVFKTSGISPAHADLNFGGDTTQKVWAHYSGDRLTGQVERTGFILKTDSNGNTLWGHRFQGSGFELELESENLYVSGHMGLNSLQSEGFNSQRTIINSGLNGTARTFIALVDMATGELVDSRCLGVAENIGDPIIGISAGKLYVGGTFTDTYYNGNDSIVTSRPGQEKDAFLGQINDISYPKINAPINLKLVAATTTSMDISWNDNSNNESGFIAQAVPEKWWNRTVINFENENATSSSLQSMTANSNYDVFVIPHYNREVFGDTSNVISDSTYMHTGLKEVENAIRLKVYPIPASNSYLNIELQEAAIGRLFSLNGKLVREKSLSSGLNAFPVRGLRSGTYILEIVRKNKKMSKRVLISSD